MFQSRQQRAEVGSQSWTHKKSENWNVVCEWIPNTTDELLSSAASNVFNFWSQFTPDGEKSLLVFSALKQLFRCL